MLEKQRNKLILGKYRFKEGILNLICSKEGEKLKLYKGFLNDNLKTLKRINATSTREKIEMELNKETSGFAFDWQVEQVSLNNIFAMMLGIIDARNVDYECTLKNNKNFPDYLEEKQRIERNQKELSEYRAKILEDYNGVIQRDDMQVVIETMNCVPSYKNFDNLIEDMKTNRYNMSIQSRLISAYMFGYNNSLFISLEEIMIYYDKIISEYKLDKAKNNCDNQKVKKLAK